MNLKKIKIGAKSPQELNAVIEIKKGSGIKYEMNIKTGDLRADRSIGSALAYPFDYGFIPETLADDGDALDVVVLASVLVRSVMVVRPIGVLAMTDENGRDEKILAVLIGKSDRAYGKIGDLKDLSLPDREKIELFFKQYKEMEKSRWSDVYDFKGKAEAIKIIERCVDKYQKKR